MEKVIGGSIILHNEQLCFLYSSRNIIKLTMEDEVGRTGQGRAGQGRAGQGRAGQGMWHTW
jgi:hypothetical protein